MAILKLNGYFEFEKWFQKYSKLKWRKNSEKLGNVDNGYGLLNISENL